MKTLSAFKLNLKTPLLSFLQFSKTTQQILQIHAQLITTNLITDPFILSQLLLSLTSPNAPNLNYAELLFNRIHQPNSFMHNTMIKGYTQSSNPGKALNFYVNMRSESHLLDNYTYPFVLKACGVLMGLVEGREIHGEVVKRGFWSDVFVVNGLIGMYSKCGDMASARFMFDGSEMLCQGVRPDMVSVMGAISACSQLGALDQGRWIHMYMKRTRITMDILVQTALVDMYMKCGSLDEAQFVLERLVELKADNSGVYVLLSNIYADVGMWNDALRIRKLIKDRNMKKETGSSAIEESKQRTWKLRRGYSEDTSIQNRRRHNSALAAQNKFRELQLSSNASQ
ncbi:hypothetical protein Q3G72_025395 [Acer saccharum]|nr:hypothetical protein Q3G72_025395 [Acer saccharum]